MIHRASIPVGSKGAVYLGIIRVIESNGGVFYYKVFGHTGRVVVKEFVEKQVVITLPHHNYDNSLQSLFEGEGWDISCPCIGLASLAGYDIAEFINEITAPMSLNEIVEQLEKEL